MNEQLKNLLRPLARWVENSWLSKSLNDVQDRNALHCHNRFDRAYRKYRSDVQGDIEYIREKHRR